MRCGNWGVLHESKVMSPNGNLVTTHMEGTGIHLSSTGRTEHMPLSRVCEKPINTVGRQGRPEGL